MGLQDSHNLGWKLALVLNGICDNNLLKSYECERRVIDDKTFKTVNRTHLSISKISNNSSRSRGTYTFVLSNILSIISDYLPFIQDFVANSYRGTRDDEKYGNNNLIMNYWIRPSLLSFDIFNNVLKRREENIRRLFRKNVTHSYLGSGDRIPNFKLTNINNNNEDTEIDDSGVELGDVYTLFRKYQFVILLFQGYFDFTEKCYYHRDLNSIKKKIDNEFGNNHICENFVKVLIINRENKLLNKLFGIRGQSLLLIRSDHYIGLRSEPISIKALKYYFVNKLKIVKTGYHYGSDLNKLEDDHESALESNSVAWLAVALGTIGCMAAYALNTKYQCTAALSQIKLSFQWRN